MSEHRTLLVTGTSSGIGLATAVACARAGWDVVATLRDPSRSQALDEAARAAGVDLDVRALDVTDAEAVRRCVDQVAAEHDGLDAVVNNAGAAHVGTIENDDLADVRACLEVNFFGVVQVSRAAMPHLRASAARERGGRLVTISSVGGVVGQPFNEAYCAAKFAVEGFMQALAPVARTVGVQVAVVEPGAVTSEFVANAGLDLPAMVAAAGPYGPALSAYTERTLKMFESGSSTAQSPAEVAEVVRDLLASNEPAQRVQTSDWARTFTALSLSDLDGSTVQAQTRTWVGI